MLVSFDNVSFSYGDNLIFSEVNFAVNEGARIGLVGENGAGKTTLIRLMLGQLTADSGEISIKNGVKIGYLEQNGGYESGNTVYSEMLGVFFEELSAIRKISEVSDELSAVRMQRLEAGKDVLHLYCRKLPLSFSGAGH